MFTIEEVVNAYKTIGYKPCSIFFKTNNKECCPLGALYILHNGDKNLGEDESPGYDWAREKYFDGSREKMSDFYINFDRAFRDINFYPVSDFVKELAKILKEMS